MRKTAFKLLLCTLAVLTVTISSSLACAATRVELVIDEPFADRSAAWPVTTGVPFPRGQLSGAEHCRLIDDRGAEQPLQARVAATWDAQRKSVRWLTIDFIAQPGRKYALEFGDDVQRKLPATTLAVEGGLSPRVSTGALIVEFSAAGPSSLGAISLATDGKGRKPEVVAAGPAGGEHYYLDQSGRQFSCAADKEDRQIVVESTGPVRACVRVDGFYTGPKGERVVKYRTRYHFFAGLPLVKVVDEFRIVGSTKQTRWRDIGFALDVKLASVGRTVTVDANGEAGNQPLSQSWQSDTQSIASFQGTYRHYGNPEYHAGVAITSPQGSQLLSQRDRMGEWMQVADERAAVTGSLRWFWQQFPKEWEATPGQLVLHLWSPRAGELDFGVEGIARFFGPWGDQYLRAGQDIHNRHPLEKFFYHADVEAIARGAADGLGINKHHEFFLHFAPAGRKNEGAEYARLAALQPLALATGQWNCSTDVFGPLAARPNDSPYEKIVDRLFDWSRQVQDEFGDYGWWLFGAGPHYSYNWDPQARRYYADSRRFEFHTYGKETQLWWNYVRSGERKFYDWAIPSENHWVDIAVSHMPTMIECGFRDGVPDQRTLHWRPGEWSIDSPTHYVRHHERAEAWLRGGAQFWASYHRTLETTTLAYYLTGDERFNDVINFWRDYFGDLAGKTSRSADMQPWHREQAWYKPTGENEPAKTWAQMIRDYAPFRSGTRHELTMFFNVATLYEHTWDERIGQALRDCAEAFLDPAHPLGVWRSQDSRLPSHAEAPSMGHFWVPALWKYARVTGDPRMPDIFKRYFNAGYAADPFREGEDVGVYSNSYLGYAYYFTRDPRFLPLAARELKELLPMAKPLARPEDLQNRIYNPHVPARAFAGIPRLIWAMEEATRHGMAVPPAPMRPQRTAIALYKTAGQPLSATLWGYEQKLAIIGPDAQAFHDFTVQTENWATEIQPFDRTLPKFAVYLHRATIPAAAPAGFYLLSPGLELAVLDSTSATEPLWNAAQPLAIKSGDSWLYSAANDTPALVLECSQPAAVRVRDPGGAELTGKITGNRVEVAVTAERTGPVRIEFQAKAGWLRIADRPAEQCWIRPGAVARASASADLARSPDRAQTHAATRGAIVLDPANTFVSGRFGEGLQIVPGRVLHLPDYLERGGVKAPLFDRSQGTLEFWVRKLWDERLTGTRNFHLLSNGVVSASNLAKLPLGEWAHVAIVWAPYQGDPDRTLTYLYVNGQDQGNYRSFNWEGYSGARASTSAKQAKWLEEFVVRTFPGSAFAIDEVRLSSSARYADLAIEFGPQQTFNPFQFQPPSRPFQPDSDTRLLIHFDRDLKAAVPGQGLEGRIEAK